MGFRHVLLAGLSLDATMAMGLATLLYPGLPLRGSRLPSRAAGALLASVMLGAMLVDTGELARLYYAPSTIFPSSGEAGLPRIQDDDLLEGCQWITEEPPIPGQGLRSYLDLAPGERGCFLWGEEFRHRIWSSRELRARGLRMHESFQLQALAVRTWPADPGRPGRLIWYLADHDPRGLWRPGLRH